MNLEQLIALVKLHEAELRMFEHTFASRALKQSEAGRIMWAHHCRLVERLIYGEPRTPMPGQPNQ